MPLRLSERVTITEGDKIKVSCGPYFMTKSGKKISMGEKGVGIFISIIDDNAIYVKFGNDVPRYVYIGKEYVSSTTGTVMKPHKIVKIRK